jgi:hypothetical protein
MTRAALSLTHSWKATAQSSALTVRASTSNIYKLSKAIGRLLTELALFYVRMWLRRFLVEPDLPAVPAPLVCGPTVPDVTALD